MFGLKWSIERGYKIFNKKDNVIARIYEIVSEDFDHRLLVLRDNCLPVLKDIDWTVTSLHNVEEKLKKYVIPDDCELVISNC